MSLSRDEPHPLIDAIAWVLGWCIKLGLLAWLLSAGHFILAAIWAVMVIRHRVER